MACFAIEFVSLLMGVTIFKRFLNSLNIIAHLVGLILTILFYVDVSSKAFVLSAAHTVPLAHEGSGAGRLAGWRASAHIAHSTHAVTYAHVCRHTHPPPSPNTNLGGLGWAGRGGREGHEVRTQHMCTHARARSHTHAHSHSHTHTQSVSHTHTHTHSTCAELEPGLLHRLLRGLQRITSPGGDVHLPVCEQVLVRKVLRLPLQPGAQHLEAIEWLFRCRQ